MNAVVISQAVADIPPEQEWFSRGRQLALAKVDLDWRMAEWIVEGVRDGHDKQLGFDFATLGKELGVTPAKLKAARKAALHFPPALRDASLSVEHHAAVASLPKDEALPLLKRASSEHLQVQDLREAVTQRRYETGALFDDEDTDTTLCTLIVRAWNRATPDARTLFADLAKAVGFQGVIDEDEAR